MYYYITIHIIVNDVVFFRSFLKKLLISPNVNSLHLGKNQRIQYINTAIEQGPDLKMTFVNVSKSMRNFFPGRKVM